MEPGLTTAQKAAEGIIERDPILGGIAILLALAIVAIVIFGWRAYSKMSERLEAKNDALYDRLIATEQKHQTDISAVNNQRAAEAATFAKIVESRAERER